MSTWWASLAMGVLLLPVWLTVLVLALQVLLAWPLRKADTAQPTPAGLGHSPRVAVLVPAHNEAAVIVATLQALVPQLRVGDRLLVVADNCTDDTAVLARAYGAEVVERHNLQLRGKGYALDAGVRYLGASPPDVLLVVDADCILSPGSLQTLGNVAMQTQRPVQALDLMVAGPEANLRLRMAEFAWRLKNWVRPLGWHRVGWPCQLMGTGMAFPWAIAERMDLANGDLVEDMKLGIDLALQDTPPLFCPAARVTSQFPTEGAAVQSQRKRWEHGHLSMITRHAPRLLGQALRRGDVRTLALGLDLMVPPLALLAGLLALGWFGALALYLIAHSATILIVNSIVSCLFAGAVLLAWAGWGRNVVRFAELLRVPGYVLAKVPVYVSFLFKRQKEWVRTERLYSPNNQPPNVDSGRQLVYVAGLPFDVVDMQGAVDRVAVAARDRQPLFVSTPNLNFLMTAQRDAAFKQSVLASDLSLADGMPIVWMARWQGTPLPGRVAGASLFDALRQGAAAETLGRPIKVFFFGGMPGVATKAAEAINAQDKNMVCVGSYTPGFGSVAEMSGPDVILDINASGADFLVVALGAQKGQAWILHNRAAITVPVVSHLGAVVNFVAGTVERAPVMWQRSGLEWLWRIKEEPGLFKRYWADGRNFLKLLSDGTLGRGKKRK